MFNESSMIIPYQTYMISVVLHFSSTLYSCFYIEFIRHPAVSHSAEFLFPVFDDWLATIHSPGHWVSPQAPNSPPFLTAL